MKYFRLRLRDTFQDALAKLALYDHRLGLHRLRSIFRSLGARPAVRAFLVLLILVPLGLQAWLVYRYGSNVPITDEWSYVPYVRRLVDGGAWWESLYDQYNENRYVVVKLVMAVLVPLTHWNLVAQMYAQLVPTALSLLGMWLVYRQMGNVSLWTFLPVAWLLIHWNQYQNYLFGLQIGFVCTVTGAVWTCYYLNRRSPPSLIVAMCFAVFATYSSASGLMIWIAGFGQLLLQRARWQRVAAWSAIAAVVYGLYFYGFQSRGGNSGIASSLAQPLTLGKYLATVLGAPLGINEYVWARAVGAGVVLLIVVALGQNLRARRLPPAAETGAWGLVLFALLAGGLIALGRAGLGIEQALTSRYISITVLGIIGVYLVYVSRLMAGQIPKWLALGLVPLLLMAVGANEYVGWRNSVEWSRTYGRRNQFILQTQNVSDPKILATVYAVPEHQKIIASNLPYLKSKGLSLFRDPVEWWLILPGATAKPLNPIVRDSPIAQEFACPVDTLYDASVLIATYGRARNDPVLLTLRNSKTDEILANRIVSANGLGNHGRVFLTLPTPLRDCQQTLLRLELSSSNTNTKLAVTTYAYASMYKGVLTQSDKVIPDASLGMELNTRAFNIRDGN